MLGVEEQHTAGCVGWSSSSTWTWGGTAARGVEGRAAGEVEEEQLQVVVLAEDQQHLGSEKKNITWGLRRTCNSSRRRRGRRRRWFVDEEGTGVAGQGQLVVVVVAGGVAVWRAATPGLAAAAAGGEEVGD